ncbi:MAG: phage major capsid protein [Magnetococcales bacterium]|nr:phage major capsid protein [Magnetococcales bacterium]
MASTIRNLQARKAGVVAEARGMTDKAMSEGRDLTDDETKAFDAKMEEAEKIGRAIDRETALMAEEVSVGTKSVHVNTFGSGETQDLATDPKCGFKSQGEFFQSIYQASKPGMSIDRRLLPNAAVPAAFGNEATGADGGYMVPPEFSKDVFQLSLGEDALLPLTDGIEIESNSMAFPKDESTPWGSNGVRAFWQAEGTAGTATKPILSTTSLRLHKLMALVPITEELLQDSSALTAYIPSKVGDSLRWKMNEAILFGSGAGMPAGAFSSKAVLTIAKESGQAANTLLTQNLAKMVAALPQGSLNKAVWLVNNDVLPALFTLTLGNFPVYLPNGINNGIAGSPLKAGAGVGLLYGRPVIVSQHANSFSSAGDVLLMDLSYYQAITKAGGIQTATSMHIWFESALTAFRVLFRMDGQSKISAPISPAKGSNKMSPFVQLGAR